VASKSEILEALEKEPSGVITWWPGGPSHNAIAELQRDGKVILEDVSTSQETVFEVRLNKK